MVLLRNKELLLAINILESSNADPVKNTQMKILLKIKASNQGGLYREDLICLAP